MARGDVVQCVQPDMFDNGLFMKKGVVENIEDRLVSVYFTDVGIRVVEKGDLVIE